MSRPATPAEVRFWAKVQPDEADACWLWVGRCDGAGYGLFTATGGRSIKAHRFAYEHLVAEIPEGLQIDHLCRVKPCVNPWHMEPVSSSINNARKPRRTACRHGHTYTETTARTDANGHRVCLPCKQAQNAANYAARSSVHLAG